MYVEGSNLTVPAAIDPLINLQEINPFINFQEMSSGSMILLAETFELRMILQNF